MMHVNPTLYRPYITYLKKGVSMLYVRLSEIIYGMLGAALLLYKRPKKTKNIGFEINPYNPCLANMPVDRNPDEGAI